MTAEPKGLPVFTILTDIESWAAGYERGYQDGQCDTQADRIDDEVPLQPAAEDFPAFAELLMDRYASVLTAWEVDFCMSFVERGHAYPTDPQRRVFEKLADHFELGLPDDSEVS
jgi:hypothetical protein